MVNGRGKRFGAVIEGAFMAPVPNHVPLKEFFAKVGNNCEYLERFAYVHTQQPLPSRHRTHPHHSDKEVVFFTGDVHPEMMQTMQVTRRPGFRLEKRGTTVLVLSVKGKGHLKLHEALQLVNASSLKKHMKSIVMVAVPPSPKGDGCTAHAYVQFCDHATALAMVNSVDAMPYKGYYVHSTQLDAKTMVTSSSQASSAACVWRNRGCKNADEVPELLNPSASVEAGEWVDEQAGLHVPQQTGLCANLPVRLENDMTPHAKAMLCSSLQILLASCQENLHRAANMTPAELEKRRTSLAYQRNESQDSHITQTSESSSS